MTQRTWVAVAACEIFYGDLATPPKRDRFPNRCKSFFTHDLLRSHVCARQYEVLIFILFVCAPIVTAQTLSLGVKGGGLFTDPAERADEGQITSWDLRWKSASAHVSASR